MPGPAADGNARGTVHQRLIQPWSRAVVRTRHPSAAQAARPAAPAFEYAYAAPQSPDLQRIYARVSEVDLLRRLPEVQTIDGMFALPRRLRYVTAECGEFGAFYRPAEAEVVLCYETLRTLYERGQEQQRNSGLGEDHPLRYVRKKRGQVHLSVGDWRKCT